MSVALWAKSDVSSKGPIDITGSTLVSQWINLETAKRLAVVVSSGVIAAGATAMTVTLEQASDNAGTGAAALTYSQYTVKANSGTDPAVLTAGTISIANTDDNKTYVIDVNDEDLTAGNTHVRATISTPGANSALMSLAMITHESHYAGTGTNGVAPNSRE